MSSLDFDSEIEEGHNPSGQNVAAFETEISPEDLADHLAGRVASALELTQMFGIVEVNAGPGQIHIMGRVKREQERRFVQQVVFPINLVFHKDDDCNGFIGKQFIFKDGRSFENMKYAWVISFASSELNDMARKVCMSFDAAIPKVEVIESPLMGSSSPQSGGQKSGRKGASSL